MNKDFNQHAIELGRIFLPSQNKKGRKGRVFLFGDYVNAMFNR